MKAIFVLRLVLVSALLVTMTVPTSYAPLAAATPVDSQSASFQTTPSDVVSADSEQSLASAAIEAVLAKERAHDGQARQAAPVQVTVEGEWGYATVADTQGGRAADEPVTVLAHRLPSGEWQAVTPRDFEAYGQWLDAAPETLVASTMKEQIRTQRPPVVDVNAFAPADVQPTPTPTPMSVPQSIDKPVNNLASSVDTDLADGNFHIFLPLLVYDGNSNPTNNTYQVQLVAPNVKLLPEEAKKAIVQALMEPLGKLSLVPDDGVNYFLISLKWEKTWGLATITSANINQHLASHNNDGSAHNESMLNLHNMFELLIVKENDKWIAASQFDRRAQVLLQHVPLSQFDQQARNVIFPEDVDNLLLTFKSINSIQQQYNGYKFPWPSGNPWRRTRQNPGWHDNSFGFPSDHSLDFDIRTSSNSEILAAASGTIVNTCDGYNGNWLWVIQTDGTSEKLGYLHIDKSTRPQHLDKNVHVNQGDYLGRMLPSDGTTISDNCGTSIGTHLHIYFPARPFTIDNHTFTENYTYQDVDLYSTQGSTSCSAPPLNSPSDGATLTNRTVHLDWNAPSCAGLTGYTLHVTTGSGPEDGTIFDQGVGPTEYDYTFPNDGTFYWHIAAWANGQRSGWSSRRIVINTSNPSTCSYNAEQIVLYIDPNYGGQCVVRGIGDYANPGAIGLPNDAISSIKVGGNVKATLCRDDGYGGGCEDFTGDDGNLSDNSIGNDQVSSAKVQTRPQSPPSAPSLQSPNNGATFTEGTSINLTWSATGNEYYGEVWGGPAGTSTFGWQSGTAKDIGSQWAGYTYSWHIKARNSAGESGWSSTWTFTVKPATPTNLNAQAASRTQVNLAWTDNSGNEEGYKIYRNGSFLAQVGANTAAYQDTNASCNTNYTYQIKAYRGSIESDGSNSATVTTPACEQAKPDLVPYQGASWAFPVVPASIPGTFTDNTLYANHSTYFDWGVKNQGNAAPGALFYVDLYIDNTRFIHYPFNSDPGGGIWFTDWSDPINMTGQHTLKIVVDPENAIAESNETNNIWQRQFTWNPVNGWWGEYFNTLDLSGNPALVRDDAAIDFVWLGDAPGVGVNTDFSTRWTRTLAFSAGTYRFSANHDDGMRLWVDNILRLDQWDTCCRTDTVDVPITAGSHDLRVEFRDTNGWATAQLTWAALSCNDNLEPNNTVSQATPIVNEQTHSGDICQAGDEDYYRFTGNAGDHIVLDINAQTNGSSLDAYLLLFDSDGTTVLAFNDDFEQLDSYLEYDLPRTGTYYAKVREYNHPNEGGPSYFYQLLFRKSSAVTVPAAPSSMSAVGVSATQINVAWADNSNNETGFRLYRSPTSTTSWTLVATLGANATSYANTATNLLCGETYRYRVRAYNSAGSSSYSNIASAQILCTTGPIFRDDFESGNLTKWSGSSNAGSMSVTQGATLVGSRGLQMAITSNTATYLFDNTPYLEAHYRMRFYLDPNSLSMANGDLFYPFYGYSGTTPAVLRVDLRRYNGNYQVRSGLLLDSGTWQFTPFYNISDAPHSIEVDWQAATSTGANNGSLTLWIDNVLKRTLTGLDNDTRRIDQARLGAFGIDVGTRGTFYLDDFVSRRDNYIGPAAALVATAPDAVLDQIDTEAQVTLPSMTAALTPGVTTTLSEELDGPTVIVVTAPTTVNAPGSAVLTAIEDDTLPDGYRRVGHAFDIGFVMVDGAPFATLTDGYTVTVAYQELDPTMSLQAWNSTLGLWEVVPTIYNAENHTVQATLQQPARLALMQVEPKEEYTEYQLHLPLIQQ